MKNTEDKIKIIFCSSIIFMLSIIGILTITNNNAYSATEGRELERFPDPGITDFLRDEIYNKYTNAFSDQMIVKNLFIKGYYYLNRQQYVGEIIKGKNDNLFLEPEINEDDTKYINELKKVINNNMNVVAEEVTNEGAEFMFISIPRKDVVMSKYLPNYYIDGTNNYLKYINIIRNTKDENIKLIDTYDILKNKNVFYKNDHHLNIYGGYEIFKQIIEEVNKKHNIKILSLEEEYEIKEQVIEGSFDRKIGFTHKEVKEDLTLKPINSKVEYTRYESGELSTLEVFGDKNNYGSAYMGTDSAETVIDTNLDTNPNILYVGTSFTNILEALSVNKFNKIVSVEYRHNQTGKSILDYVKEHEIDYVVYICSQSDNALNTESIKQQLGY